jgi:signal transducer and activator of transcription 5B
VRLLIGNKLNVNMGNPQVTAKIISEKQARDIKSGHLTTINCPENCDGRKQCSECNNLVNNIGYMEYNQVSKQLSLSLNNMMLKSMSKELSDIRKKRSGQESVLDKKFALLFQSTFTIGHGDMYNVWAFSLPIVLTSHTNQKVEAWSTITWDNAFSDFIREPFVVPDKVSVTRLAEALNLRFKDRTGRYLTDENLHFLCQKAARMALPMPLTDQFEVSWSQFCKEDLPNCTWTFWTWFYNTMKLTRKRLTGPWNDGLIMGFLDGQKAEEKLYQCQNGTFLIRFSESCESGKQN